MTPKCCVCGIEDPIPTDGKVSNLVYWYRYVGDDRDFRVNGFPAEDMEDLFQEIADKVFESEESAELLCPDCLDDLSRYSNTWDDDDFLPDEDIFGDDNLSDSY